LSALSGVSFEKICAKSESKEACLRIFVNYLLKSRYCGFICFFADVLVYDRYSAYFCSKLYAKDMYATISADIVSSTSLSEVETIELKQYVEEQLKMLETVYPNFWGRLIKGDYIECVIPNASDAFRIALIIKNSIKAFKVNKTAGNKLFYTYGARIAIGIGSMRIVDREQGIMDGEAIYLSGRSLAKLGPLSKGALAIETTNDNLSQNLRVIALLTDAILNNTTPKQSQVIYYKLLGYKESEIAEKMNIYQSGVNNHSSSSKWYCIEEALDYFEQIKFENYE